jgi:hypothetical protein
MRRIRIPSNIAMPSFRAMREERKAAKAAQDADVWNTVRERPRRPGPCPKWWEKGQCYRPQEECARLHGTELQAAGIQCAFARVGQPCAAAHKGVLVTCPFSHDPPPTFDAPVDPVTGGPMEVEAAPAAPGPETGAPDPPATADMGGVPQDTLEEEVPQDTLGDGLDADVPAEAGAGDVRAEPEEPPTLATVPVAAAMSFAAATRGTVPTPSIGPPTTTGLEGAAPDGERPAPAPPHTECRDAHASGPIAEGALSGTLTYSRHAPPRPKMIRPAIAPPAGL